MKKVWGLKWMQLVMGCCLIATCLSCLEDDKNEDWSEVVNLYVSSETGAYYPLEYPNEAEPLEGIKIKENIESEWIVIHINGIEGFTYKKGFEYYLKVEKIHLGNPPADSMDIKYKLIEIISKK